ncbi:hypothetical protein HGRIS_006984 [Hohenbuehelia grisea]|uniref:Fungal N-terminal domain-containing protein n=1 Tax=Hohenbuehelia grisea TaxID=104357 RepID=A0ABR3JB87_9AGAR
MDGVSLAASVFALIDAAAKLKATISKVKANSGRTRKITEDITQRLSDIATFDLRHSEALGSQEAAELKVSLDDLSRILRQAQTFCEGILAQASGGRLSSVTSSIRAWFKRNDLGAELEELEERIHSAQLRFTTFAAARAELVSLRAEHNIVVLRQESRDRSTQLESLVSQMLLQDHKDKTRPIGSLHSQQPDIAELDFLEWQTKKLLNVINQRKSMWAEMGPYEEPHETHYASVHRCGSAHIYHCSPHSMPFHDGLMLCLSALRALKDRPDAFSVSELAVQTLYLALHLADLSLSTHGPVIRSTADLFSIILAGNKCFASLRFTAKALTYKIGVCTDKAEALATAKRCADMWQSVCDTSSADEHFWCLIHALCESSLLSRQTGEHIDGLEYARQSLTLLRDRSPPSLVQPNVCRYIPSAQVSWLASGEADVVFSSERSMKQDVLRAFLESIVIRHLAYSFASVGRYSEARIAMTDALSCHEASHCVYPCPEYELCTIDMRKALAIWVPIARNPPPVAFIEEVEDPPSKNPLPTMSASSHPQ